MSNVEEITCIITGRVQMVMYRDYVLRKARSLAITGFVKNENDGSVHVLAQGKKENLLALIVFLKQGPLLARVDNVSVAWGSVKEKSNDFSVMY